MMYVLILAVLIAAETYLRWEEHREPVLQVRTTDRVDADTAGGADRARPGAGA